MVKRRSYLGRVGTAAAGLAAGGLARGFFVDDARASDNQRKWRNTNEWYHDAFDCSLGGTCSEARGALAIGVKREHIDTSDSSYNYHRLTISLHTCCEMYRSGDTFPQINWWSLEMDAGPNVTDFSKWDNTDGEKVEGGKIHEGDNDNWDEYWDVAAEVGEFALDQLADETKFDTAIDIVFLINGVSEELRDITGKNKDSGYYEVEWTTDYSRFAVTATYHDTYVAIPKDTPSATMTYTGNVAERYYPSSENGFHNVSVTVDLDNPTDTGCTVAADRPVLVDGLPPHL